MLTHTNSSRTNNSNILLRFINQILDFAKQDKNQLVLNLRERDLIAFARKITEQFKSLSVDKEVTIKFSSNIDTLPFIFDPDQMEEILYNLLSNAIKHTPSGGCVICDIQNADLIISIKVVDDGAGMSEEVRAHIFERFYSIESSNTTMKGTGIGLALTRSLIKLHGGEIDCHSIVGKGTTFTIQLPKSHLDPFSQTDQGVFGGDTDEMFNQELLPEESVEEGNEEEGEVTILVVDDNHEMVSVLSGLLSPRYHVIAAYNGKEGYEACLKYLPALVITDVMMPVMNGIELCHCIKGNDAISYIPVVMLTAKTTQDNHLEGFTAKADAYCKKPFDNKVVLSVIQSLLANRKSMANKFRKEFIYNTATMKVTAVNDGFINQIISIVDKHIIDEEMDAEYIANIMNISKVALSKKLKAITGQTTTVFIRSIRLKRAAEMLATNEYTVQEVTYATGFNDLKYFRKCFKEEYGVSPSEFRKDN